MTNRQLKDMMRDIPPRFQQKANARAAAVQIKKAPVLPKLIGAAAVCCAGLAAVIILPGVMNNEMIPATSEQTDLQEMTTATEQTDKPWSHEISASTLRLTTTQWMTSPAFVPYAVLPTENQYRSIYDALDSATWYAVAPSAERPKGEAVTLHVRDCLNPENMYRFVFYVNGYVQAFNSSGNGVWYQLSEKDASLYEMLWLAANDQEDDWGKRLVWIDESTMDTPQFWDNFATYTPEYDMYTKEGVFDRMRNSVDYIDRVSGTVLHGFELGTEDDIHYGVQVSDFQCDLNMGIGYEEMSSYTTNALTEMTGEEARKLNYDYSQKFYFDGETLHETSSADVNQGLVSMHQGAHRINYPDPIPYEEIKVDGEWNYRDVFVPTPIASSSISPEYYSYVYLYDFSTWEITGHTDMYNRSCVTLRGRLDAATAEALHIYDYEMTVDEVTGMLVRFVGYGKDGEVKAFILTENLKFDTDADYVDSFLTEDMEIIEVQ